MCVFLNLAMLWKANNSKLAEGITLDAERVTRMAGQGAVYVRSLVPLEPEDEGETEEELENSALDYSPR